MDKLKEELKVEVYQNLIQGNIQTPFYILTTDVTRLQELTNLSVEQIQDAKRKCVKILLKKEIVTADKVLPFGKFSTGCSNVNLILNGGIPIDGVTEIYGCSGVGKTQFCLQLSLMVQLPLSLGGYNKKTVYICTEDVFPSKRFHQLANHFKFRYNTNIDFEKQVFLKHVPDFEQLRRCLKIHLPNLLGLNDIGLLIIDSLAGTFRGENLQSYFYRSQEIVQIALILHKLNSTYKMAIVCVNQVADDLNTNTTVPCLGLTWSNNVTRRFEIRKCNNYCERDFRVIFSPDLPNQRCTFKLSKEGLTN